MEQHPYSSLDLFFLCQSTVGPKGDWKNVSRLLPQHITDWHRESCWFTSHSALGSSPDPSLQPRPTATGCEFSSWTRALRWTHPTSLHGSHTRLHPAVTLADVASAHITDEHLASAAGLWGISGSCYKGSLADNFKESCCENVSTISISTCSALKSVSHYHFCKTQILDIYI